MLIAHTRSAPSRAETQPAPYPGPDRSRRDVGTGPRLGDCTGIRLQPDPHTDPTARPTGQVSGGNRLYGRAATDPCLGVSRWGKETYRWSRLW